MKPDDITKYTARIELLNGDVLLYRISGKTNEKLISRLADDNADADHNYIWFETAFGRLVVVNIDDLARIKMCFDFNFKDNDTLEYKDNFKVIEPVTSEDVEEWFNAGTIPTLRDIDLPELILFHRGAPAKDKYGGNPAVYNNCMQNGHLADFYDEIRNVFPLRKLVSIIDNDGEVNFIPTKNITLMEISPSLFSSN